MNYDFACVELCKELSKLCPDVSTGYYWANVGSGYKIFESHNLFNHDQDIEECDYLIRLKKVVPAFSVGWLGKQLPYAIKTYYLIQWYNCDVFNLSYAIYGEMDNSHLFETIQDESEADARIKMRIKLLKEGLVKVEDVK